MCILFQENNSSREQGKPVDDYSTKEVCALLEYEFKCFCHHSFVEAEVLKLVGIFWIKAPNGSEILGILSSLHSTVLPRKASLKLNLQCCQFTLLLEVY